MMLGIIRDSFTWSCLQGAYSGDRRQVHKMPTMWVWVYIKCPRSIRNKTPIGYKNGTHVHSSLLCCALPLISRDAGVLYKIREVKSLAQGHADQKQQGRIWISACPQGLFFLWWAAGNPRGDTSAVTLCWWQCLHLEGWRFDARVHIWVSGSCSETALRLHLLWSITAVSTVPLTIGNAGDFAFKQNLPYQHCWCVYKGVFLHLKPLS